MVFIKTPRELEKMRESARISAEALRIAGDAVKPGISTMDINRIAHRYITSQGAKPNFLGYNGFPAAACISVNNEVIHGIPARDRILKEGDIVSIDLGAVKDGYHGDNAATFPVGEISEIAQKLINVTKEALYRGVRQILTGKHVSDIAFAIQSFVEENGFSVVRDFVGHGIGKNLHEEPSVQNFVTRKKGTELLPGMTIAVEPMVNVGSYRVKTLPDKWTVITADGSLSAHFEHTVAVTENEPEILTRLE